jgi:hypothetical protein
MLILFDHGTPRSIARWLHGHTVVEAIARGWDRLSNGALLKAAEEAGFDLLLSTDKNIRYQQNLRGRRIAIVILGNSTRPVVHRYIDRVTAAVNAATPGSFAEVEIPYDQARVSRGEAAVRPRPGFEGNLSVGVARKRWIVDRRLRCAMQYSLS